MKPTLQNWFIARAAIVAVSMFFAAFAVYYWASPLWEANRPLAIAIGLGFTISAAITPCVTPKLIHARGFSLAGLSAVCVVFACVDSLGVAGGFNGLEKDLTQAEFDKAVSAYQTERANLGLIVSTAQTKIDALPSMTAVCEGHGPQNCAARQNGLEADRKALTADRDTAKADLDALAYPVRPDRFDNMLTSILSVALQIVLSFGLIALEATRQGKFNREQQAYETMLADRRAERDRKAKAKQWAAKKAAPSNVYSMAVANDG